jgi:hypothetical protein
MFLRPFYHCKNDRIKISAEQGSRFAKSVCDDFNPIHDPNYKRFCVPGDLLFALTLERYGISQRMRFGFSGMLSADTGLIFPMARAEHLKVTDSHDRCYLELDQSGLVLRRERAVEALTQSYVRFSGRNFPHILLPLMAKHNVMINPQRPLVVYASMSLQMHNLEFEQIETRLLDSQLEIDGKRGNATLTFEFMADNQSVGSGSKHLILSGLRDYQQTEVDGMVERYNARQAAFLGQ